MRGILFLLVTCAVVSARAQVVQGRVSDITTKEVLTGVLVYWPGTSTGQYTDESGKFTIDIPVGAESLAFAYVGYKGDTIPYTGQTFVDVALWPLDGAPAVVIEGEIKSTEMNTRDPQKFQVLSEKELCKAACCNLSESFETNASIDASFTDAITGTRQIKMLGLDGRYTQILFDNIPTIRGLSSIYGLSYLPGPWIKEISISKGTGSVISGYESMTGQINVAHKSREMKERIFINAYAGSQGRFELNSVIRKPVGKSWSTSMFIHGAAAQKRFDMNRDGFLDNPLFQNIVLRNEWSLIAENGIRGEYSASYHHLENISGQYDYLPSDNIRSKLWGVNTTTDRGEVSAKTGYVFEEKDNTSVGSQVSVSWHDQRGNYGNRIYSGQQLSARINLLFASQLNEHIKYTSGISYVHDDYSESLDSLQFGRIEKVPGVFTEVSLNHRERLMVIAGGRADYHNSYGWFFTPRLHLRYSLDEKTSVKLSGGKGYRSPNLLMDNVGLFGSNRNIIIEQPKNGIPYGLNMEESWNYGVVFTHKFKLNHRDGSISIDAYRTDFIHAVVVDWETPREVRFYNLQGKSYSDNFQIETQLSPVKRLELRLAYRWIDAHTDYQAGRQMRPLVAKHRFFGNLAFATKEKDNGAKWMFDVTAKWLGKQRLPSTTSNPDRYRLAEWSNDYWIFNAQISRHFNKQLEVYIGGENLSGFIQKNPIISAADPTNSYFDASLIWGPVFGQMGYAGLRWRIQ